MNEDILSEEQERTALCPWRNDAHADLYADVDNAGVEFVRFCGEIDSVLRTSVPEALTITVTGADGTGKTSFLNRCALEIASKYESGEQKTGASVFDLSTAASLSVNRKNSASHASLARRVVDEVSSPFNMSPENLSIIERRIDEDVSLAWPLISRALEAKDAYAIVMCPPQRLAEDICALAKRSGNRLVFLIECSDEQEAAKLQTAPAHDYPRLLRYTLGLLRVDDGWHFVQTLVKAGLPEEIITEDTINKFMRERLNGGAGRTTIRELQKTCRHVLRLAISAGKDEVTFDDFAKYYVREGIV